MDKKYLLIAAVLIAVGLIYWKFFHKRKGLAHVAKPSTPAVKKRGGGGWRHRLSHLASGIAHTALQSVPGGSAIGQVAGV